MANWTTSSHSNLIIETNLDEIFLQGFEDEKEMIHEKLYKVKKTPKYQNKVLTFPNLPLYAKGKEGQNITTFSHSQKYKTTSNQERYEGGFVITWELGQFDMYDVIDRLGTALMKSAKATIEYYGADPFNNQTSVTAAYKLADGKALVASDHPLKGGGTASNNAGAVDIGVAALDTALYHYETLVDDNSLPRCSKTPIYIIAHPNDRALVTKLLKSKNVALEMSNTYNPLQDYNLIPIFNKWFSDTDAWGLLPGDIEYNLCYQSYAPDSEVTYEGRTRNKLVTSFMFFDYMFADWRDVYMGQGG